MKKRVLSLLLAAVMVLSLLPVSASASILSSGTCGDGVSWELNYDGVLRIYGSGAMDDYSFQSTPWADYRDSIKQVVIDTGVTGIGSAAFSRCSNLSEVTVKGSLRSIGMDAFKYCGALTEITIPDTVTNLGSGAFMDCTSLQKVTLPSTMTVIPAHFLRGCRSLKEITIPETVTEIGTWAFGGCTGLTAVTLPRSLKKLAASAFRGCTGLTALDIPAGVSTLNITFADGCTALAAVTVSEDNQTYSARDNVIFTKDGTKAIWAAKALTQCSLPEGTTTVGADAFSSCKALTAVTLPSTITTLEADAFENCTALTQITFLGDAPAIDATAFKGVKANVNCSTDNDTWTDELCQNYGGTLVWNNVMDKGDCGENLKWTLDTAGVLTISGSGAMKDYYSGTAPWYSYTYRNEITGVVVKEGVTYIGNYAFYSADQTVTYLPVSLTGIGHHAFTNCGNLKQFVVAEDSQTYKSVDGVLYSADGSVLVFWPKGQTTLTFAEGVTEIGASAFASTYKFTNVTLPEGITRIGDYAFEYSGVETVTLPNTLTELGDNAFAFSDLKTVTLPDSLTKLGKGAFQHCEVLKTVTFGSGLTEIPQSLFSNCEALTSLSIPEGVTTVGGCFAWSCPNLTYIEMPSTLKTLDQEALVGCGMDMNQLQTVYVAFSGDAPEFDGDIFDMCKAVCYYPADNETWNEEFFAQHDQIALWVPIGDCAHDFTNGRCRFCNGSCSHVWEGNRCLQCNFVCSHSWTEGVCGVCGGVCAHSWENSTCTNCGCVCSHSWSQGVCGICGYACPHSWEVDRCTLCAMACPHTWSEGVCTTCTKVCTHNYIGNACGICSALKDATLESCATLTGTFNHWNTAPNMIEFENGMPYASLELEPGIYEFKIIYDGVTYGAYDRCLDTENYFLSMTADAGPAKLKIEYAGTYEIHYDDDRRLAYLYYIPDTMYVMGSEDVFGTKVEMTPYGNGYYYYAQTMLDKGTYNWVLSDEYGIITVQWKDYQVPDLSKVTTSVNVHDRWSMTNYDPVEDPVITPRYPTLSFEDEITMNVYFEGSKMGWLTTADMGLISFDSADEDGTIETADAVVEGAVKDKDTGLYMVRTNSIPAKDLSGTQYFKIYVRCSDGTYVYSELLQYSPISYAATQLADPNASEAMKALAVSMLSYGGAAQRYFGSEAADADAGLTQEQKAYIESYRSNMMNPVVKPDAAKLGSFAATETGFTARYPTISFEGAFAINYYFLPNMPVEGDMTLYYWDRAAYEGAESLTEENAVGTLTVTEESAGTYSAAVENIAAKDLDDTIYVSAVYSDGTNRYCSGVLAYSIGAYCVTLAQEGNLMAELAAATAVYGYYAKQYFQ